MGLTFNGVTSDSIGVIVDGYYAKSAPERRITSTQIPGRNGNLVTDDEVYENITVEYDIYWVPTDTTDLQVTNWLKQGTYYRLIDSQNSQYYRMTRVVGPVDITNHSNCYHSARVSFDCKPQLFLLSGETAQQVSSGGTLTNPTQFSAFPLLELTCTAKTAGTLVINGSTLYLSAQNTSLHAIIDCEIQNAYYQATNLNPVISGEFPKLSPGSNTITFTGGITAVKVTPRWWTI